MNQVQFRQMKDGTASEYRMLAELEQTYAAALPNRLLNALQLLGDSLQGYQVSRLQHSLQAATRAERDGADEEMIAAALLHDIGDDLAPHNHAALAAEILRPYVRPKITWIVAQHGVFQAYYYAHHTGGDRHARNALREHKWFNACASFCEKWDQASFDPDYDTLPLGYFAPLLDRIFKQPKEGQGSALDPLGP
jgi:predicted HD phosphohydrolase